MKAQEAGADPAAVTRELDDYARRLAQRGNRARYVRANLALEDRIRTGTHPLFFSFSGSETNPYFHQAEPLRFASIGGVVGVAREEDGRAVVAADVDGDGDLDLLLRNAFDPPLVLLVNQAGSPRPAVRVQLEGTHCHRSGIGATVEISAAGRRQTARIVCGSGYLSCGPPEAHFGLGDARTVDQIDVHWPCGRTTTLRDVAPGALLRIREDGVVQRIPFAAPVDLAAAPAPRILRAGDTLQLELETLDGRVVRVPDPGGRTLALHIWSARPATCGEDLRRYTEIQAALEARGIGLVSVNLDPDLEEVAAEVPLGHLPVAVARGAPHAARLLAPGRPLVPVWLVVDGQGRVLRRRVGTLPPGPEEVP